MENQELNEVSVIETALAKENVTNRVISKLKENYLGLKINGIDDKIGFKAVEDARKECKQLRNVASKICKLGREEAIKTQKDWIAKEKEVVASIEEVELYLEKQSDEIKELEKQILFEAAQKAKLPSRIEKLKSIDITVNDEELLKINDEQFGSLFNEFYEKHLEVKAEALRAETQRIADEKEAAAQAEHARLMAIETERIKQQAIENERLKKEAEEKEKALEIERKKAEQIRLVEKDKADAILKAEQEKAAKAKAEVERLAKIESDKQFAIIAEEKAKAEKLKAELKAKQDAEDKIKADKVKQDAIDAENKRLALLAPDKDKLKDYVNSFSSLMEFSLESYEAQTICTDIQKKFSAFKKWAISQVDTL